jgi:SAM-dependent methyltransferase
MNKLHSDIFGWDIRNWSRALELWERQLKDLPPSADCLEIGTANNGGLALWLSIMGHKTTCLNLVDSFDAVRSVHQQYDLPSQPEYHVQNAFDLDAEEAYDVIAFKSLLGGMASASKSEDHALERLRPFFARLHKALKPGGVILFADNLRGSWLHQVTRNHFVQWAKGWHYLKAGSLESLFDDFDEVHHESGGFLGCMGRTEGQRNALARLDQALFEPLMPRSWHYFAYGWARKSSAAANSLS